MRAWRLAWHVGHDFACLHGSSGSWQGLAGTGRACLLGWRPGT